MGKMIVWGWGSGFEKRKGGKEGGIGELLRAVCGVKKIIRVYDNKISLGFMVLKRRYRRRRCATIAEVKMLGQALHIYRNSPSTRKTRIEASSAFEVLSHKSPILTFGSDIN